MTLRDLFLRIRALVARDRVERELDEEVAFHIDRETQRHVTAGLDPVDARTRALARFGPLPLVADQCRDALLQSLRPLGIGLFAVAIVLLATPSASEIGGWVDVFDPAAYIASALVIITACLIAVFVPTLRAARIDPMSTLRND